MGDSNGALVVILTVPGFAILCSVKLFRSAATCLVIRMVACRIPGDRYFDFSPIVLTAITRYVCVAPGFVVRR